MKTLSIKLCAIITITLSMLSCNVDDVADEISFGNEYQLKIGDEIYEETSSILASIYCQDETEGTMIASINTTLSIAFEREDYIPGKILNVGYDEDDANIQAAAGGSFIRNLNTENEEFIMYIAMSGTATIVSKKRIEFNFICCDFTDLNMDGSISEEGETFTVSGYVTEETPD